MKENPVSVRSQRVLAVFMQLNGCWWLNHIFYVISLQDSQKLLKERLECLRLRTTQFVLPFSYWPSIEPRQGGNIYEVRSYTLKPGTMIEWGNNWARAINYRQHNEEAFAGFFSQVGRLYNVHHFWCKLTSLWSLLVPMRLIWNTNYGCLQATRICKHESKQGKPLGGSLDGMNVSLTLCLWFVKWILGYCTRQSFRHRSNIYQCI